MLAWTVSCLAALFVLGSNVSLRSLDVGGGEPVTAYSVIVLAPQEDPGCTPIVRMYPDGSMFFHGCPTQACATLACQSDFLEGHGGTMLATCECQSGGKVLCRGYVVLDVDQVVIDWYCQVDACQGSCPTQEEPPKPGTGHVDFPACLCQ